MVHPEEYGTLVLLITVSNPCACRFDHPGSNNENKNEYQQI